MCHQLPTAPPSCQNTRITVLLLIVAAALLNYFVDNTKANIEVIVTIKIINQNMGILKSKEKEKKNVQHQGFAGRHRPNY